MTTSEDWQEKARRILRAQLAAKDMDYKGLSRALVSVGIDETPKAITNRINRGTFSFAFFLQCMKALGVDTVNLRD